jgi:linoleoyl-CoA desaturase
MTKISFTSTQSPFFQTLKQKVDNYFAEEGIHRSGNKTLYFKSAFQILSAVLIYTTLVFMTPGPLISILLCGVLGINLGVIGFNVMHEGGHNSFSKYHWLNVVSGHFLNIMGGNIDYWKIKHNINHHTYTNIEGLDSDIDIKPFMRIHNHQPLHWYHRFQHIYWVALYGISYIAWIFYDDFVKYFSGKISKGSQPEKMKFTQHIIFWSSKLFYVFINIILPVYMVGLVSTIIGFSIVVLICGLSISVVFQLAHVVEDTQFPLPNEKNKIEQEWAIHQISTTANFATKNRVISWLLGGLNFQVEHHLFPKISHVHYPKVSILVKETCEEFNLRYIEYPSFFKAFRAHYIHIKRLGVS